MTVNGGRAKIRKSYRLGSIWLEVWIWLIEKFKENMLQNTRQKMRMSVDGILRQLTVTFIDTVWKDEIVDIQVVSSTNYVKTFINFHHRRVHKLVSNGKVKKDVRSRSSRGKKKMEEMEYNSNLKYQEEKCKIWSHSFVILGKLENQLNSSLRKSDGPLSLTERQIFHTSPELQGTSCVSSKRRQRWRRTKSSIHRARCYNYILGHYLDKLHRSNIELSINHWITEILSCSGTDWRL